MGATFKQRLSDSNVTRVNESILPLELNSEIFCICNSYESPYL